MSARDSFTNTDDDSLWMECENGRQENAADDVSYNFFFKVKPLIVANQL
jgi:hypothetical protein